MSLQSTLQTFDETTQTVLLLVIAGVVVWGIYELSQFNQPGGGLCQLEQGLQDNLESPQSVGVLGAFALIGLVVLL